MFHTRPDGQSLAEVQQRLAVAGRNPQIVFESDVRAIFFLILTTGVPESFYIHKLSNVVAYYHSRFTRNPSADAPTVRVPISEH